MTKEEIIKIIQEEEARIWKYGIGLEKDLETGRYVTRRSMEEYIQRTRAEWTAISELMEKLDIKKLDK